MAKVIRNWLAGCALVVSAFGQSNDFRRSTISIIPTDTDSSVGTLRFFEKRANGTHKFVLKPPVSLAADVTLELPGAAPASGQCLGYSSSTVLAWVTCAAGSAITSIGGQTGATQTFGNDTNVTMVSGSNVHTLTWSGTLAKARMAATTVHTDQANTWSTGLQDFSAATMKIPIAAGCAPATTGLFCIDSTSHTLEVAINGINRTIATVDGNVATASALENDPGNCSTGQFVIGIDPDGTLTCTTPTGAGDVLGPATHLDAYVPVWGGLNTKQLTQGYAISITDVADSVVLRDSGGGFSADAITLDGTGASGSGLFKGQYAQIAQLSDSYTMRIRRYSSGQADHIVRFESEGGTLLSYIDKDGKFPATMLTGNLPTANFNSGTGASSATFWRGDGTWATPSGSGNVSGPGASTDTYFARWSGSSGTILGAGIAGASTTATASTVMLRDSNGAYLGYDKGGFVYDARAFGSINTSCGSDARTVVQAAIDYVQDSTGGVVLLPAGCILINSQISQGNGSTSADSTKKAVILVGHGMAAAASDSPGTELRWGGGNQGSLTYMVKMSGPGHGGGIKNMLINANGATNVSLIDWQQWGHGVIEDVTLQSASGGAAIRFHIVRSSGRTASNNNIRNLTINSPGTNGEGVYLTGCDATLPAGCSSAWGIDSASNRFYGGSWWGTNYALKLEYADANVFDVAQFQITGSITSTTCGIVFAQSSVDANYPQGNFFYGPMTEGYCGSMGTGNVPNHFLPLGECDSVTYCNPKTATTVGTAPFVISANNITDSVRGLYGMGGRSNSASGMDTVFFLDNNNAGHDATGVLEFRKSGAEQCKIRGRGNDGLEFWCNADGGGFAMTKQMFITSWGEFNLRSISRSTLSSYNSNQGSLVLCVDCAKDASCSSSAGTYALAFKKTSGIGLTNWTCNFQ